MKHPQLMFEAAFLLFVGCVVFYLSVVRGTLWAIPVVLVAAGAAVLMVAAHTQKMYGQATAAKVAKVAMYTIGYNIIGWSLLWLGGYIVRSMR
jgi:hypothetical protein